VKKLRFFSVLGAILLTLAIVLLTPLPHYLRCSMIVVPDQDRYEPIYIEEAGILQECLVKPGDQVEKGQPLARLSNLELELKLAENEGRLRAKEAEVITVTAAGAISSAGRYQDKLPSLYSEIRELTQLVDNLRRQSEKLDLRSPLGGTVLETPYTHQVSSREEDPDMDQPALLSGKNRSVSVTRGQRFCEVADLSKWQAYVLLTEHQIKFAKVGNEAVMKLYYRPWEKIRGPIEQIGVTELSIDRKNYEMSQQEIASLGQRNEIPNLVQEMVAQYQKPELQYYARVPLEGVQKLRVGVGGQAFGIQGALVDQPDLPFVDRRFAYPGSDKTH